MITTFLHIKFVNFSGKSKLSLKKDKNAQFFDKRCAQDFSRQECIYVF